jgi:hypothetical protein
MVEYEVDVEGMDVKACLVKETRSRTRWEEKSMMTGDSIRISQVMHVLTLIANMSILIVTGINHDWNFAVSQTVTRCDGVCCVKEQRTFHNPLTPWTVNSQNDLKEHRRLHVVRNIRFHNRHGSFSC